MKEDERRPARNAAANLTAFDDTPGGRRLVLAEALALLARLDGRGPLSGPIRAVVAEIVNDYLDLERVA